MNEVLIRKRENKYSFLLLILGLLFISSCSSPSFKSGKYILLKSGDSLDQIAIDYGVQKALIVKANPSASWYPGEWIFVPAKVGILPQIYNDASLYGWNNNYSFSGELEWPLPSTNRITSLYGEIRGNQVHNGLDIGSSIGTPIVAAESGVVSFSGTDPEGYGELLILKHEGDISTLYGHLFKKLVVRGQQVKRGDIIALVGNSGRSTGPHLHFEVRREGKSVDPLRFFK